MISIHVRAIAIVLTYLLTAADSVRVLGIFPLPAKSHFTTNLAIMESLHAAGHQITLVSPFPPDKQAPNFTHINSHLSDRPIFIGQSTMEEFYEMTFHGLINTFAAVDMLNCYDVIELPEIQEALNSKEKLYDVMFVEVRFAYDCYLPMAQKLGIPVIGTIALRSYKFAEHVVGLPNNPAVIPLEKSPFAKIEMNFVERVANLWNHLVIDYYYKARVDKEVQKFCREHYPEDLLNNEKEFSMLFMNNHPTFMSRPLPPNVIDVGGISVKPARPLPKKIREFIDGATHGAILFTFGSVMKASTMSSDQKNAFLAAFASIPQRILWKFEEPIENLPPNIMISSWLPQRDILEHSNVIAFMSHCGQGAVYEAILTATPIVAVPIFVDQQSNAEILQMRNVAISVDLNSVTKEAVVEALNKIINDTTYRQRMQEFSRTFQDRPMSPQEQVVYWTEYLVRHNGAPHLKALGYNMPLYKYLMLDILALAIIIMSFVIIVICSAVRKVHTLVAGRTERVIEGKKNQ